MASTSDRVNALQTMFASEGWRKYFVPELQAVREGMLFELIYSDDSPEAMRGLAKAIQFADIVLSCETTTQAEAQAILDDPQEAENSVVHSAPEPVV